MKTAADVQKLIDDILSQSLYDDVTKKKLPNRILSPRRKKVAFYNVAKMYLDSNPTEDFLIKELKRLEYRLSEIDKQYPIGETFSTIEAERDFKKEFNKKWSVPKLKEQIKALKFLIK